MGSKMGFVDHIYRNSDAEAKPASKYDEEFLVAQIDAICKTVEILQQNRSKVELDKKFCKQIT